MQNLPDRPPQTDAELREAMLKLGIDPALMPNLKALIRAQTVRIQQDNFAFGAAFLIPIIVIGGAVCGVVLCFWFMIFASLFHLL